MWYRDEEKLEGMMSTGYIKDGTQEKIIAALESALFQAKGQMQLADNVD
ncbi:Rrf2 family transcriptional regulator [Providencia hangzhouensis]